MADQQDRGDIAHRRPTLLLRRADRQQQLVLGWCQPRILGQLRAPMQRSAQPTAQLCKPPIVLVREDAIGRRSRAVSIRHGAVGEV